MKELLRPDWLERLIIFASIYYVVMTAILTYIVWRTWKWLGKPGKK